MTDVDVDVDVDADAAVAASTLTPEQIAANQQLLERAIELGMQQYTQSQEDGVRDVLTPIERTYVDLLDPLLWIMREALETYLHEDCEDCRIRRETQANNLALAIAETILLAGGGEQ